MRDSHPKLHSLARWIGRRSTKRDFARRLECSESHLNNILAGRKQPSLRLADRIAQETNGRFGIATFRQMEAAE